MDALIIKLDKAVRVVLGLSSSNRPNPADGAMEKGLDEHERRRSAGLMRVNHVGEVCAQALYEAQGRFSVNAATRQQFVRASREEEDHLAWTAQRLRELGARPSLLNPVWYAGAYALGAMAAKLEEAKNQKKDKKTKRHVEAHLESHLRQ